MAALVLSACFGAQGSPVVKPQPLLLGACSPQDKGSNTQEYGIDSVFRSEAIAYHMVGNRYKGGPLPGTFWAEDAAFRQPMEMSGTISICKFRKTGLATYYKDCVLEASPDRRHLLIYRVSKAKQRALSRQATSSCSASPPEPANASQTSCASSTASSDPNSPSSSSTGYPWSHSSSTPSACSASHCHLDSVPESEVCGEGSVMSSVPPPGKVKGPRRGKVEVTGARAYAMGEGQLVVRDRKGQVWHFLFADRGEVLTWLDAMQCMPGVYRCPEDLYDVGSFLGEGSTCRVATCRSKVTGNEFVLKSLVNREDFIGRRAMHNELQVLQMAVKDPHPSLPRLEDYFFEANGDLHLICEYLTGGELMARIDANRNFSERRARELTRQILDGVAYLHQRGIAHRDLKPRNLVFESNEPDSRIKIIDFDLAKLSRASTWEAHTPCGTTPYMAPEVIAAAKYDKSVDIWSVGTIVYMMIAGRGPFHGATRAETESNIRRHHYTMEGGPWEEVSYYCKDFIRTLLSVTPADRPTAEQALAHPWLRLHDTHLSSRPIISRVSSRQPSAEATGKSDDHAGTRQEVRPYDLHLATQLSTGVAPPTRPVTPQLSPAPSGAQDLPRWWGNAGGSKGDAGSQELMSLRTWIELGGGEGRLAPPQISRRRSTRGEEVVFAPVVARKGDFSTPFSKAPRAADGATDARRQKQIQDLWENLHQQQGAGLTSSLAPIQPEMHSPAPSNVCMGLPSRSLSSNLYMGALAGEGSVAW